MTFRKMILASTACVATSLLLPVAALAQEAPAEGAAEPQLIVVTGSRIAGNPANAPQPVQVVTAEDLEVRGITSAGDAVETIPALIASNNVEQTARDGLAGRVALNLRNMGVNRTLVLVNGRRHVAGIPGSAAVDVTSIPSGLIERVDVLTGGAASVYGSDAVTGVVNFVTRQDFVGTEFEAQFGTSFEGDAGRAYVAILQGYDIDNGAGNITISLQAEARDVLYEADRDSTRDNGLWTRDQNPELRFQANDPIPAGRTREQVIGRTILNGANPRFANTDPALVARARAAKARAFGGNQVFSGSATQGLIGLDLTRFGYADPAGSFSRTHDTDGNGVDDCRQSFNGIRGYGCWVVDQVTGQVRPFRDGIYLGEFNQQGGDGAAQRFNQNSMVPGTSTVALNVQGNYGNDTVEFYFEAKYVYNRATEYNVYNGFDDSIPIALDNPFIPAALRTIVNNEIAADPSVRNTAQFVVSRDHIDIYDPKVENTRQTFRFVAGFEGELPNGWNYDVSVNYGRTDQEERGTLRLEDRFFSAVDAVIDPATGQPTCRINLNPNSRAPISALTPGWELLSQPRLAAINTFNPASRSCVPINVFQLNTTNPWSNPFLNYVAVDTATIEQTVIAATLSGDSEGLFSLPGGPVSFVVGAEYRDEKSDFRADPFKVGGFQFQFARDSNTRGGFDVSEAFVEVRLPLLADMMLAQDLSLSGSYRLGEYSTIGSSEAWSVGVSWTPIDDIRFRAVRSSTVRAPNIGELFSPESAATFRPVDPCDQANRGPASGQRARNCLADGIPAGFTDPLTARFTGVTAGNPNLEEETAETYTIGFVLRPRLLEGFVATVDYWNIELNNAIAAISAQNIVDACYDGPNLQNQFCTLFTRNRQAGSPTFLGFNFLRQQDVNFARQEVSGVDFDFRYSLDTDRFGAFGFSVGGSYLEKRSNFEFFGDPTRENPEKFELNNPEWVLNTSISWTGEKLGVDFSSTYIDEQLYRVVEFEALNDTVDPWAPGVWSHSVTVTYTVDDDTSVLFGIDNLTGEDPWRTEYSIPVSVVGRSFFLRVATAL